MPMKISPSSHGHIPGQVSKACLAIPSEIFTRYFAKILPAVALESLIVMIKFITISINDYLSEE